MNGREPDEREGVYVRLMAPEAAFNLLMVLRLCDAGQVRCSERTGRPSAATVRTIGERLANGDFYPDEPIAAFAWPLLLRAGGLVRNTAGRLRLAPKGRAALERPPEETIALLWERWLSHAVIDEFSRIETIKGQRAANALSAAKYRRITVAEALADCPPGEWFSVDRLFSSMRRRGLDPQIARNERALWKLYLVDPQYGSLGYAGFHPWTVLQGRYTLAVLFEYAGTLGLFDLEYVDPAGVRDDYRDNWGADDLEALSRYDGLCNVRLNAVGERVLAPLQV